jgi:hypothetical protein
MRLVRLSVEHFQCIRSAELDFGRGLNVLYGPNDLGKSSLAWAIRAVLLLQHNAAAHERFVSWYGDGEPRVALTLCDDEDRTWRVTKTFGGAGSGRSHLESSKDGRTFITEASGRQVDDRLRTMLRWGIQRPGGQGPRGFPTSFLTQVLLAEQDNVPRVLFDGSLVKDPDDSGRLRLTEALSVLAQDPLFKKVLASAQSQVDVAFTPTGQRRRGKGSPFVDIADKLNGMLRERDELEGKVRETAAAEARVRQVSLERDEQQRKLEDARSALAAAEAQLAARQRRDAIQSELDVHLASLRAAEDVQRRIGALVEETPRLQAALAAGEAGLLEAAAGLQQVETQRDQARRRLDMLAHEDVETERRLRALEEQQTSAQENLFQAERSVDRATEGLRQAREVASVVAQASELSRTAAAGSAAAEEVAARAAAAVALAEKEVDQAQERLQTLTRDDGAQARERQRTDLDNRRLTLEARKASTARALEVAEAAGKTAADADAAETLRDGLRDQVVAAQSALAKLDTALGALAAERDRLHRVELFARARQLREALAAAAQTAQATQADRSRAVALRTRATALRAEVHPELPAAAEIAALRALRDDLRVAEARLGGGLSVTVRPRRSVALRFTIDGKAQPASKRAQEVVQVAEKTLAVSIADLVEVEVTAGEESARQAATKLRRRWARQAAPVLARHEVDSVEDLASRRDQADAALRAAAEAEREADQIERTAVERDQTGQVGDLGKQLEELERELGDGDRAELGTTLAGLGEPWPASLKQRTAEVDQRIQARQADLARQRDQVTRLQAQLEIQVGEAEDRRKQAARAQAGLADGWAASATRRRGEVADLERDLAGLVAELTALSADRSAQEGAARAALASAEERLAAAQKKRDDLAARAQVLRDGAVQATTRLADARARARQLDPGSVWTSALEASSPALPLVSWEKARSEAEEVRDTRRRERAAIADEIARVTAARAGAIQNAREALEGAEERARAARDGVDSRRAEQKLRTEGYAREQAALAELRIEIAGANLEETRRNANALQAELAALGAVASSPDASDVSGLRASTDRLAAEVRDSETELAKARGALEQVGGAIVRERQRDLDQAIQRDRAREHETEIEFDGWKLLVDTLRAAESAEGAHLGRALAGPVSERFRSLTAGRYGQLELDPHLEATGLQVAGNVREIAALSAGTQDQLATLLRVCIAEQLQSAIVLDDHLSQSDPARIAWFNGVLRDAARQVQIILITCRPSEVLAPDELPTPGETARSAAAGLVRVVDMTKVISRFAPMPAANEPSARS